MSEELTAKLNSENIYIHPKADTGSNRELTTNMDVLIYGTEEERKIVLTSFMYWLQQYTPHDGLVDEFFNKIPNKNMDGKIVL